MYMLGKVGGIAECNLLHTCLQIIRIDMKLTNEDVSMMAFTSEQITAPFLLPEMVNKCISTIYLLLVIMLFIPSFFFILFRELVC